ncbi:uncharacterized protein [Dermacentor albipictus]|uniref:uncharacterized protein n=1 Tax=Dermacentor albipictus TaxID=60249 RepID=UPI0038FD3C25
MAHQQLPDFDDERDNWKAYVIKAEAYFEATGVKESAKKRALLVAALSTRTVQILAGRVAPKKPNSLEYEDVVKVLDEFFDPKRHEITESFRFFNRCQLDGESVQEFITEIRRIADNCNFGTMLDRMLRDRIVCGIRSSALQKQLLTKKDLSVEEAETMALSAEAADKDANKMATDTSAVLKIKAQSASTKEVLAECGRCGSIKHNSNACRWSNARCYHCGRLGHLAVKCRKEESARSRTREGARGFRGRVLAVKEGETDEDKEDSMHIWTLKSTREVNVKPPMRCTFTWGGVDVSMLIDTGSPVCVVSRQLFEQHKNIWPSLRPSRMKLSCYLGKLPVFGELLLPVSYDSTTVECTLVVLDCPGPSLCGRDLISLLSDAGSPVLSLSAKPLTAQPSTTTQVTADVFAEFPDVFSSDLGLIKGPAAHLQLKEGATPKFCREFILVTDHQPLLGLLRPDRPTPPLAAARIQRWALYLGGFRYKLQYSPGKQLLNSDALSRLPQETLEPTTEGELADYVLALASVQEGAVSVEELQALTAGYHIFDYYLPAQLL